jgi:hypothetical protein
MNLLEFQRRMAADVKRPLTPQFGMRQVAEDGRTMNAIASRYVKESSSLSSFERLEIYNKQYWLRLVGAVSEDYSTLLRVLGQNRFDALILAYLRENPSTSFTLRDLGGRLPSWLAKNPGHAGARHELAVDVARLEWAYVEAFDGASLPPLSMAEFANLLPGSVLSLQPHLQLLDLRYPVDEIVLSLRQSTTHNQIASNAVTQKLKVSRRVSLPKVGAPSPTFLAVHRFENSVYYRRIDREAFLLLSSIRLGDSITTMVDKAFKESSLTARERADKVREYFTHASELGWLAAA